MKFEIKTTESAENGVNLRFYIDGIDITDHTKKVLLYKGDSATELTFTVFGDINVSIEDLELQNIKKIDSTLSEYQYTAKEKKQSKPRRKLWLKKRQGKNERYF